MEDIQNAYTRETHQENSIFSHASLLVRKKGCHLLLEDVQRHCTSTAILNLDHEIIGRKAYRKRKPIDQLQKTRDQGSVAHVTEEAILGIILLLVTATLEQETDREGHRDLKGRPDQEVPQKEETHQDQEGPQVGQLEGILQDTEGPAVEETETDDIRIHRLRLELLMATSFLPLIRK
ncbi:hypothetical protein B0H17DRAFT_1209755 [Mycena rosella]|uniref:Uncharacterized protein n=1 Tax=Mycena rosella TaxID=1033263 RepID=A0AAD7CYC7_MYCRO|nr:hypothetical protein B0H17DRAFT_1209755 [Mycena rosella]